MILSRVVEHVRKQHWSAIFIECVIVVLGVFLGMQANDWNQARADRHEYQRALQRLENEMAVNLETVNTTEAQVKAAIAIVDDAFDALMSCEDTPENRERINQGLHRMRMTYGITLRRSAVDELTGSPALLAQQSAAMRQRLSDLRFTFDYVQQVADRSEHLPEESGYEMSPLVAVGPKETVDVVDRGVRISKTSRAFVLAGPVDRACRDEALPKSFAYWERWQTNIPVFTGQVRREIEATAQLLARERG